MSTSDLARLARQHARTAMLMGVDFVPAYRAAGSGLGDRAAESAAPAPSARVPTAGSDAAASAPSRSAAPARQATTARSMRDPAACKAALDAVRARYESCAPHDAFGFSFTNLVFGEGDPAARLMFVGEAPGEDEDRTGRPFVGRAGQLLEKMIQAMGLSRERVYICNVLKVRPPGNRPPAPEEVIASAPFLYEQIAAVDPEVIVTLGRPASHLLLNTQESMGRMRGRWAEFVVPESPAGFGYAGPIAGRAYAVMPTYHPSFLLRSYTDENRKAVWSDLRQVLDRLGLAPPRSGGGSGAKPA